MKPKKEIKGKVLFILPTYDPLRNMRGLSVKKVAEDLINKKVDVHCLSFKENSKSLKFENYAGVRIFRVNQRYFVRFINNNHANVFLYRLGLYLSKLQGLIMSPFWPLLSIYEVFRLYKIAKKNHLHENYSCVIGCYKRIETLLAALLLKRKFPEIKFIAYTLDCMSRSLVPKILSTNIAEYSIKRWERIVFSRADYVCIMQSHQKYYRQEAYKRFENKFVIMDIPLFELKDKESNENNKNENKTIKMVFTGSMSESTANPVYFIKILEKIQGVDFVFDIYGGTSSFDISQNIKNSYLHSKTIFWHGIVAPEIAAQKQKEADILLSFGNDNECMIPSKIFEYISHKKHIIHLYKSNTDSALPYFEKYGNATMIREVKNLTDENLMTIRKLLMNLPESEIDNLELQSKFYYNTAKPMADFLINLLEK